MYWAVTRRAVIMPRRIGLIAASLMVTGTLASTSFAQTLKQEPPMGKLQEGQRVLVDNGKCPAGQIMEVTGGNHVKVGGKKQIERSRRCIPKR
jgi:hypothetical protein